MANRIIDLGQSKTNDNSLLVYKDIDLVSIPASITYKPLFAVDLETTSFLSSDLSSNNESIDEDDDNDYILQDENHDRIRFFTGYENTINSFNSEYNNLEKQKAVYKLDRNINVDAVKQSIHNIFSWTPGERILNPEFGSKLRTYLYEGITTYNQEMIMAEIRHCMNEWEPRAQIEKVVNITDVDDKEDNTVVIDIIYSIPSLSPEQYAYRVEVETEH